MTGEIPETCARIIWVAFLWSLDEHLLALISRRNICPKHCNRSRRSNRDDYMAKQLCVSCFPRCSNSVRSRHAWPNPGEGYIDGVNQNIYTSWFDATWSQPVPEDWLFLKPLWMSVSQLRCSTTYVKSCRTLQQSGLCI